MFEGTWNVPVVKIEVPPSLVAPTLDASSFGMETAGERSCIPNPGAHSSSFGLLNMDSRGAELNMDVLISAPNTDVPSVGLLNLD